MPLVMTTDTDPGTAAWTDAGDLGIGGGILPMRDGAWVDPDNGNAADDGDRATPFITIQAAIDSLEALAVSRTPGGGPPYTTTAQARHYTVLVASGIYDEDLVVPPGLAFYLIATGSVTLGNGAGDNLVSTNARNVTWEIDGNWEPSAVGGDGIQPNLFLTTWANGPSSSTHTAYDTSWIISGDLRIALTGVGPFATSTKEMHLDQVKVVGDLEDDFGGPGTGRTNGYFRHCFFDNAFTFPGSNVQIMHDTEVDGALTCGEYNRLTECQFQGSITVSTGFSEDLPPGGFINCTFSAITFTSPSAFVVDAYSNFQAKAVGVILAGGATKVIRADTTP